MAKVGVKKAIKEFIEKKITGLLASYTKKNWAKQLGSDALDAIDMLDSP